MKKVIPILLATGAAAIATVVAVRVKSRDKEA